MHIHEFGDTSGGCGSTGGHFNPENMTHGSPSDVIRHVDDLGNIEADESGKTVINFSDSVIQLGRTTQYHWTSTSATCRSR
ncbi:Superoxide dismutase [Cu-Zn] [Chamberlinius hualienensis]